MNPIVMPRLSDTMESGTIVRWLFADGAFVQAGDPIVEVDTDKTTVVIEADSSGRLHIQADDGANVPVGGPIGQLLADSESPPQDVDPPNPSPQPTPRTESLAGERAVHAPHNHIGLAPDRPRVSPVARRLAIAAGLDVAGMTGSGPNGRVLKTDVVRSLVSKSQGTHRHVRPLSRIQRVTAQRTTASKQNVPHFYLSSDVDMTDAAHLRRQVREEGVSITDVIVRACALTLSRMPAVNAAWAEEGLIINESIDIGLAVGLPDGGLVVPVIRHADMRPLLEIAEDSTRLIALAHSGQLSPNDYSGGTFTVSNLGMHGIHEFHAIINPPESGILAVGAITATPVVRHGAIVVREMMRLSLSADHRVYSGTTGAEFLRGVRDLLEAPLILFR